MASWAPWAFDGYPPELVMGVRLGDDSSFAVFVAETVPGTERDRILREMGQPAG